MAKIRLYLDTRNAKPNEQAPLKLVINHNYKSAMLNIGVSVEAKYFDAKKQCVFACQNYIRVNSLINTFLLQAKNVVLSLTENGRITSMTAIDIRDAILDYMQPKTIEKKHDVFFIDFFSQEIERKNKRTAEIYSATLKRVKDYCDDDLTFEDITFNWLTSFNKYLKREGNNANTIAIHLRNIRAVINSAIDEELTTNYPFRKFKIKTTETRKRSLSVDKLREIITLELKGSEAYHRDMLVLSFLLIGINSADLYNLDKIINGRIEYDRAKTGRHYSIKVEPEAMELTNKYKGKKRLIDIADRYYCVESFTSKNAKVLKNIRSGLSSYWARHTWATIAYSIGISTDIIAQSLGHSNGLKVTNIYINPSLDLVDNANRKVIDFIFQK